MAAPQGIIRTQQTGQKILFRVEGRAQMDLGLALRRSAEQGMALGANTLLMDLRQCDYMDSTFLGTLLFLKRLVARRQGAFCLIAPSSSCCELLKQMGLSELFPAGSEEELACGDWTALSADLSDIEAFKCNVMQAHVELANLPGAAGKPFKKVAEMMTQEREGKHTP